MHFSHVLHRPRVVDGLLKDGAPHGRSSRNLFALHRSELPPLVTIRNTSVNLHDQGRRLNGVTFGTVDPHTILRCSTSNITSYIRVAFNSSTLHSNANHQFNVRLREREDGYRSEDFNNAFPSQTSGPFPKGPIRQRIHSRGIKTHTVKRNYKHYTSNIVNDPHRFDPRRVVTRPYARHNRHRVVVIRCHGQYNFVFIRGTSSGTCSVSSRSLPRLTHCTASIVLSDSVSPDQTAALHGTGLLTLR